MAEDQDKDQKTEEPTQQKLDEARKRGQVVTSRELTSASMLFASFLAVTVILPMSVTGLISDMRSFIELAPMARVDENSTRQMMEPMMRALVIGALPTMALLLFVAIGSYIVQHGFVWSAESLKPTLSKISPLSGFKRLFGMKNLTEFVKTLIKVVLVACITFGFVWPYLQHLEYLVGMDIDESTQLLLNICGRLLLGLSISVGFLAGADYLYQRFVFLRDQRMTLQEVKDEMRNSEGDPMIKARLKQIRRQRAKKRMMAAVPKSTVVITNPTHFAVALKFEMGKMEAPILVAKGMDEVARRIRAVALENSVPILENPPLARALHKDVELEQEIPMEHYQAVAEIIGYILRLKGKVRSQGPAVPPPGSRLRRD